MMNNTQAPGQAAPAALPTMLAQQNGATPPPQVGQLSQMPVEQLKQLFFQTMQGGATVPPLSILAAIKTASERQRMQQAVMGQAAQQQAAQQPGTVRDEVLAQAQPAAGGIQALASGGPVQSFAEGGTNIEAILRKAPAARTPEENEALRRAGYTMIENRIAPDSGIARLNAALARPFIREATTAGAYTLSPEELAQRSDVSALNEKVFRALGGSQYVPDVPAAPAPAAAPADQTRPTPQEIERAVRTAPAGVAAAPRAAAPGSASASARTSSSTSTRGPAVGGLAGLEAALLRQAQEGDPSLGALGQSMEANARERAALLERMQGVPPEVAAARKRYEETMRGLYEPQRKAAEEARAATKQGLLSSPEALARLAAAASGKKRFGEALGATAGAAGEVLGERRKRAEQLESSYQTLQAQLNMTLAQAALADANGDEKRKQEMLLQAQDIKERLTAAQLELAKTGADVRHRAVTGLTGILSAKAQDRTAAAAEARASRDARTQDEAARSARLLQAINTSPRLKALAKQMEMLPNPQVAAEYAAEERRLISLHMPELLIGSGSSGSARPAADAIINKGN